MAATAKRTVSIYVDGREVENTMNSLNKEIRKQKEEWRKLNAGTTEYFEKAEEIKRLTELQKAHNRELETAEERTRRLRDTFLRLGAGLGGFTQVITTVKNSLNYLRDFATELAKLDDKMHLVRKTTNLTMGQIHELNREFMKIDTRTSREELNDLAYAAGKLGISTKEGVLQFVKAADEINVALGDVLGGTDSIIEITKMMEVFRQSTKEIAGDDLQRNLIKTGSVLNELGKRSTANEKNMAAFLGRISGVSSQLGISLDQAAGFASVFDQTKQHVEMSATALQRMFTEMIKRPGEYAKAAGMELEKFKELMSTDFNEAAIKVLEGFGRAGGMEPLVKAFKDMGLDGQRAVAAITQLASHTDMLRTAQQQANEALREGTSTGREYQTMNESMQAQMEKARKAVQDARVELGEKMYPAVIRVLSLRSRLIKHMAEASQKTENWATSGLLAAIYAIGKLAPRIKTLGQRIKESRIATEIDALKTKQATVAKMEQEVQEARLAERTKQMSLALKQQSLEYQRRRLEQLKATGQTEEYIKAEKTLAQTERDVAAAERQHARAAATLEAAEKKRDNAKSLNVLKLLRNHWMLVATAVLAAASELAKYIRKQTEARRKAREMNAELANERAEINRLFGAYRNANGNLERRKEIMKEINDKYGEYLQNQVDEKGNLLDIANAQAIVNAETEKAIRKKFANTAAEPVYEDFKKQTQDDINRILKQGLGKEFTSGMYDWIAKTAAKYADSGIGYWQLRRMGDGGLWTKEDKELHLDWSKFKWSMQDKGMDGETIEKIRWNVGNLLYQEMEKRRKLEAINAMFGIDNKPAPSPYTASEVFINGDRPENGILPGTGDTKDKIMDKWKALLERISDLNRRYSIKETPMSKAKQQLEQEYSEMKDAVEDFYGEYQAYTEAGEEKVLELDAEMWRQIRRLDREERQKAIKETEDRLKDADNRMEAFRLKQRRKSQSRLETDLEEISGDFQRLTDKVNREIGTMKEKLEAGERLEKVLSVQNPEELGDDIAWLGKYGITLENIRAAREKLEKGKTTGDILTELGTGLDGDEEKKLRDLLKLLDELEKTGLLEKAVRVKENMEDLARQYMSTGRKAYEERRKALETQMQSVGAAIDYYEQIGADESKLAALKMTREELEEEIEKLRALWEKLSSMRVNERDKATGKGSGVWDMFGISQENWEDWRFNWQDNLEKMAQTIQSWWNEISGLVSAAMELQSAVIERQTKEIEEQYDERSNEFRVMLDNNIISQKYYDAQMERLNREKEEKEKKLKHTQFETERGSKIAEALMNGAMAVTSIWAQWGKQPIVAAILTAVAGATNALQVAAISSQPNPYAKGSYIRGPQIALMGEEGDEWVASNRLLRDSETAAVIEALDQYQKGNRKALESMRFPAPETKILSHTTPGQMRTFAPSNTVINNYGTGEDGELLKEMRLLRKYLEDPRNRQATINRNILLEYEKLENSVKETARL